MRNCLYKWIIHDATDHCYRNCLSYFQENARILDVGIGNGMMMRTYHPLIKTKGLNIVGLDINKTYLNHCDGMIHTYGLHHHIQICHQPVEVYEPKTKMRFDFILFSMSFMLIHDQSRVLDRVKAWLTPDGKIVFFQTLFRGKFKLMEFIKPRLKYITTIDFGNVIYERDLIGLLQQKGWRVLENRRIRQTWYRGRYHMIVAEPADVG